ncbi:MAG: hypothetical protein ABI559_04125 [Chloroflexota bacterium]
MSPQEQPHPNSRPRKPSRPAEFRQQKALSVRTEYHYERLAFVRTPREYFSPFAPRR